MNHRRYLTLLVLIVMGGILCLGLAGCTKNDNSPTGPGGLGPQPELFPGLQMEEWYFFDANRNLDHYESFTYQYENGRRVRGEFFNSAIEVLSVITYNHDDQGRIVSEDWSSWSMTRWSSPPDPDMTWTSTYLYSADGVRVLGADAAGAFVYQVRYEHDSKGRRSSTTMTSIAPPGGYTLRHQYDDRGRCFRAIGEEQLRGLRIIIVYTY